MYIGKVFGGTNRKQNLKQWEKLKHNIGNHKIRFSTRGFKALCPQYIVGSPILYFISFSFIFSLATSRTLLLICYCTSFLFSFELYDTKGGRRWMEQMFLYLVSKYGLETITWTDYNLRLHSLSCRGWFWQHYPGVLVNADYAISKCDKLTEARHATKEIVSCRPTFETKRVVYEALVNCLLDEFYAYIHNTYIIGH